jgi:uncharacterized protein
LAAVLDTSVVVAFINRRDEGHVRVSEWIEAAEEDLVTTPLVVAEIDHLVSYGGGPAAALAFYEDLASGAYVVEWWQEAMFEAVEAARSHQASGLNSRMRPYSRSPRDWRQRESQLSTSSTFAS